MNTETRTIHTDLTPADLASGKFIPVAKKWAKKYTPKEPVSDADFARIMAADARRKRRAEKRRPSNAD